MFRDKLDILKQASETLGFNALEVKQGSEDWKVMKLGVLSGTGADALLAGKTTQKKNGYFCKMIAQVVTGIPEDEFNAKATQWGVENESAARTAYELVTGEKLIEVPFIYKDKTLRTGVSPDGILEDFSKGVEIKCPYSTATFIDLICNDKVKPEYIKQVQFSMWVTGLPQWDFVCYDPRVMGDKINIRTFEADEKMHEQFEKEVKEFLLNADEKLAKLGHVFGDQWRDRIEVARRLSA